MSALDKVRDLNDFIKLHGSYVAVFSTPDGQRVLEHICKKAGISSSTFVRGDSHETAYLNGKRDLALSILKFIGKDHNALIRALQEGAEHEN